MEGHQANKSDLGFLCRAFNYNTLLVTWFNVPNMACITTKIIYLEWVGPVISDHRSWIILIISNSLTVHNIKLRLSFDLIYVTIHFNKNEDWVKWNSNNDTERWNAITYKSSSKTLIIYKLWRSLKCIWRWYGHETNILQE